MRNILKNFDRIGLVVLLAAFFVTVGFKATDKMEAGTWYEVEITDLNAPELPQNQKIVGLYPNGAPDFPCDSEIKEQPICAIELEGNLPLTFPITVDQATTNGAMSTDTKHSEVED